MAYPNKGSVRRAVAYVTNMFHGATGTITAFATGGQTNATPLTADFNRVSTVATAGDSVLLPVAKDGREVKVYNDSANNLAVFPLTGDAINDQSANASVTVMPNSVVSFNCFLAANGWHTQDIAAGYSGSYATQSYADNLTAKAGGGQSGATLLPSMINRVVTVATAADSTLLPLAAPGIELTVINAHASNSMNVFPTSGDAINALSANAAFAVAAGKTVTFFTTVAGKWHTMLSA